MVLPNLPVPFIGLEIYAAAVFALIYWGGFCYRDASAMKSAVKTTSVLLLTISAWKLGGPVMLIAALFLCMLGDFLLSLDGDVPFMAGVGAFAGGHIAYVTLFLTHPRADADRIFTVDNGLYIAVLAFLGVYMIGTLWRRAGSLRGAVIIYVPIILAMGLCVLAVQNPTGQQADLYLYARLAWWGALFFILSDLTLAYEKFVFAKASDARKLAPFVVWPTYWGAQLLLLIAFVGLGPRYEDGSIQATQPPFLYTAQMQP
ncbi:lysoplasmalogenase [Alisedimentitalea sp. MJ-SS2]|uniref:lysoplasmalogenase n=1 Tax=Aliisedimentitalea sp. MJ-SS2 TaxID=3049795 RepID=UPI002912D6CC|nr:lysoplasmalogenase [Alisedimentitalea sp. MJ-SS2]MDU8926042.1 lysoplasmalogenase [Alisedimentitalea sp. MJ-SS2]